MKLKIIVRPEAEEDLTTAYRWYEKQSPGLGAAFLLSVDAAISGIQRNPDLYPKCYKKLHRTIIRRFPFGIYYLFDQFEIHIIAVFHMRRNPTQLIKRK